MLIFNTKLSQKNNCYRHFKLCKGSATAMFEGHSKVHTCAVRHFHFSKN